MYQLSQVFSAYGYEPKAGTIINSPNINVTGSNNRIYYKRPFPDNTPYGKVNLYFFNYF